MVLKILAFLLLGIGALFIFVAEPIAKKLGLIEKVAINSAESEFNEEDDNRVKREQAILQVKKYGLYILTPAVVLIFIVFR